MLKKICLCAALAFLAGSVSAAESLNVVSSEKRGLPFEEYYQHSMFTLPNGLRVMVHEDPAAVAVTVAIHVHVGSKDEPQGKTGFAHLFEHLLFNGTETNPGEFFKYLKEVGATGANGSTGWDVTNYFETVPRAALEKTLWLEADRMANSGASASEESLKTQVDVVINEKNLSDNEDFGTAEYTQLRALYPDAHPYSHSIIGSIDDLRSATVEDVKRWYNEYYGARNTVLALGGDITLEDAKALAGKYFSHLPSGPALNKINSWPVSRKTNTVQRSYDTAASSALIRTYVLPPQRDRDSSLAAIAMQAFASGENSPLYKALVDEQELAHDVGSYADFKELDTSVLLYLEPKDGISLDQLANALDRSFADFLKKGPSQADIDRVYGHMRTGILGEVGRPDYKTLSLVEGYLLHDDPYFYIQTLEWIKQSKPIEIKRAANKSLAVGYHEERRIAVPAAVQTELQFDPLVAPPLVQQQSVELPDPNVFTLNNGLEVVHLERSNIPEVNFSFRANQGSAHVSPKREYIDSLMAGVMMEQGVPGLSREQLLTLQETHSISLSVEPYTDFTELNLTVNTDDFEHGMKLWNALLMRAEFKRAALDEHVKDSIEQMQLDRADVGTFAESELLPREFDGESNMLSYDEKVTAYKSATVEQLHARYKQIFQPQGAKLYVVGDIALEELKRSLDKSTSKWRGQVHDGELVKRAYPTAPLKPKFILIDDQGANQTRLFAMRRVPNEPATDPYVDELANSVIGGGFTSRLNMNLREDKGWTYGIYSDASGDSLSKNLSIQSSVAAANTVDAIKEVNRELTQAVSDKPITQQELDEVRSALVTGFRSQTSTNEELLNLLKRSDEYKQSYDYFEGYIERHRNVNLSDVRAKASDIYNDKQLTWLLVGDLSQFESKLRDQNLGDIAVYSQKGERIR